MSIASGYGFRKGENIPGDRSSAPNVGIGSNPHELVYRAKRAHGGPLFHRHVAGEGSRIGQYHVAANHTIMGNVGVSHD